HERFHLGDALHLRGPELNPGGLGKSLPVLPEVGAASIVVMAGGGGDFEEGRFGDANQCRKFLQLGSRRRKAQHSAIVEDESIPAARWHQSILARGGSPSKRK